MLLLPAELLTEKLNPLAPKAAKTSEKGENLLTVETLQAQVNEQGQRLIAEEVAKTSSASGSVRWVMAPAMYDVSMLYPIEVLHAMS